MRIGTISINENTLPQTKTKVSSHLQ